MVQRFIIGSCSKQTLQFSSVQLLSHVRLFATPRTTAHQASLGSALALPTGLQPLPAPLLPLNLTAPLHLPSLPPPSLLPLVFPSCPPWRRQWHPTPILLPGKAHGQRNLVGCSPWSRYKSDTTEWLPFHFSLSCTGEGNGNPLQCSWLENPGDGGAWWAAVYGVAQSQTRPKRRSSGSGPSSSVFPFSFPLLVSLP